ncbi:hypothetical protein [Desulfosporosinus lacus]|uniref:Uncharacterized protein n=1 Tax=Desulfosporosinus lacus DSM 15449 TaxID=1121420 RepID=A0A1M5XP48_9FIRM|nr:hypothetical protein [Desulfosporosinus lacus]SHI01324.1 hypothetical protein SAMN02746098_02132 [Desulfosporosinus lacus DSM 15449]
MLFPYGEWVILFLTLLTWAEKKASRRFFLLLTIAWLIGKWVEISLAVTMPWHWHFARLAVMLVFWVWSMRQAERWLLPLFFTSLIVGVETLFFVNEPGVFPYGEWMFAIALVLVAWLSAKSFWGTAAALTGSALLNQAFVRFTYDGIIRYIGLPNEFTWNFGVGLFTAWAALALGWQYYAERELRRTEADLIPSKSSGTYEPSEESKFR